MFWTQFSLIGSEDRSYAYAAPITPNIETTMVKSILSRNVIVGFSPTPNQLLIRVWIGGEALDPAYAKANQTD